MPVYEGSCHCGSISFRIEADITDVYQCDCSLCRMKNALMTTVHESKFELLSGEQVLREYNWNTGIARHFNCGTCGIYPFHKKRAMPDSYGINVNCLRGFDPSGVTMRAASGKDMTVNPDGARDIWPGPRES